MAVLTGGIKTYKSMTKEELIQELIMKSNQLEEMEKKSIQDQVGFRRLATMVRDSNDAITIQDLDGTITEWNRGAERMYGYSETEALGMNILDIVPDLSKEEAVGLIQQIKTGRPIDSLETKRVTKDKRILDVWLTITKLTDDNGRVTAVATTERDITERKQMEHKLKLVSMTDDMTGLYNRRGFRLLAEKLLLQAERNNNRLLLLYCDLDNLKVINDRFGHREGDQVIMDFVDILKNTFRKADIIARLGGDRSEEHTSELQSH